MPLEELRSEIDRIDDAMLKLFKERMDVVREIGRLKRETGFPALDRGRERAMLCRLSEETPSELSGYVRVLFNTVLEMSRSYQAKESRAESSIIGRIEQAIADTPKLFPENAIVACPGTEGAYSQSACDKIFTLANIMYFSGFEGVFQAVDKGLCRYGVLPLENSTAGSVNEVYDLMNRYNFYIVRSARLQIRHALLAPPGVELKDVKEIFSKDQAIQQCGRFLKSLPGAKATACENTAVAAKRAAESGRKDVAVIASEDCAALYGLSVLSFGVQDTDNNYTRFICISKTPEIYPGADRTSLMLTVEHRPGSLYSVIAKLNALGINLNKLESRPIPGSDFEFMFYFDIDAPVYSPALRQIIAELEREASMFDYLGSYQEI